MATTTELTEVQIFDELLDRNAELWRRSPRMLTNLP